MTASALPDRREVTIDVTRAELREAYAAVQPGPGALYQLIERLAFDYFRQELRYSDLFAGADAGRAP